MSTYVSASMLDDYLSCKRKVYYRLNFEGESPGSRESYIGQAVHKILEDELSSVEQATEKCARHLSSNYGIDDVDSRHFVRNCFDNYFKYFKQLCSRDDKKEVRFKVHVKEGVFVVGRMDRITSNGIIDWKTNRKPPSKIDTSVQFILYNWAYKKQFNKSPAGVYLASLTHGSLLRFKESTSLEDILINQVIPELVRDINNRTYAPTGIFKKACFNCFYSEACLKELYKDEKEKLETSGHF